MGVLTDLTDFVGLTDTEAAQRAAEAAKFDPYNITSTFGGVRFEEDENKFYSSLDPTLATLGRIQRDEALRNWACRRIWRVLAACLVTSLRQLTAHQQQGRE